MENRKYRAMNKNALSWARQKSEKIIPLKLEKLLCFWLLFLSADIIAQCPISVSATAQPPNVCGLSGNVTLSGQIFGGSALDYFWEPAGLVNNPNSLTTTATVSGPTTFTFTARAMTTNNLILNGDFESGNSGFTSDFNYVAPGPAFLAGGVYTVITSPSIVSGSFPPCDDHTSGAGNMLLVNASNNTGADVWCQTISVNPNSDYIFEAFVGTVGIIPVAMNLTINGIQISSTFNAGSLLCDWQQFTQTWSANGATTATICLSNQNGSFLGPVFALDDISMIEICRETAQVQVDIVPLSAFIEPPSTLGCATPIVTLDGSNSSSGPFISYTWSSPDGNIVSGQGTNMIEVDFPGSYTLDVIYDDGAGTVCSVSSTVFVSEDAATLTAVANVDQILDCEHQTVQLNGVGSSVGPDIEYLWTTADGNIISRENTLFPLVDASGTYTLTVSNQSGTCQSSASVFLAIDTMRPRAIIRQAGILNCTQTSMFLDGRLSSNGADFSFEWFTFDGNFSGSTDSLLTKIDTSGTYFLVIRNDQNNCADTTSTQVTSRFIRPRIALFSLDSLTCKDSIAHINASGSSFGPNFLIQWTTANGSIVSGDTTLILTVNATGNYRLTITDTTNNCKNTLDVPITRDTLRPTADAGDQIEFPCRGSGVRLDGKNLNPGSHFLYEWTTADGVLVADADSLNAEIGSPGTYYLSITDTLNGCYSVDSVLVIGNASAPSANIRLPDTLDCQTKIIRLDATTSDSSAIILINWQSSGGSFLSGANTLQPSVEAPGIYRIILENSASGCQGIAEVEVMQDTLAPDFDISVADTLNCLRDSVAILVSNQNDVDVFVSTWKLDGTIFNPTVSGGNFYAHEAGTYSLFVENTTNHCSAEKSAEVFEDRNFPVAEAGFPDTLNCGHPSKSLNGSILNQVNPVAINWFGPNGLIANNPDSLRPMVSEGGIYYMQVRDLQNGCLGQDSVTIFEDKEPPDPTVYFSGSDTITCANPIVYARCLTFDCFYFWQATQDTNFLINNANYTRPGTYVLHIQSMGNLCEARDTFTVFENKEKLEIQTDPAPEIGCGTDSIQISARLLASNPRFSALWTSSSGDILSGADNLNAWVGSPGTYHLQITNLQNGCISADSVVVNGDGDLPKIQFPDQDTINCTRRTVQINTSGSSSGAEFSYQWQSANGRILSGAGSPNPIVDTAGIYYLTLTNLNNDCQVVDSIVIGENFSLPTGLPQNAGIITCEDSIQQLSVLFQNNSGLIYNWYTPDGQFSHPPADENAEILKGGVYFLEVIQASNGCRDTFSFSVQEDKNYPNVEILPPDTITCAIMTVRLDGSQSDAGQNFEYLWTNNSGLSRQAPVFDVAAGGWFYFSVKNRINGCTSTDSILVITDTIAPLLNIQTPDTLTCNVSQIALQSFVNPGTTSVQWMTQSGNFNGRNDTTSVLVNSPGLYSLTATDPRNGCTETALVTVPQDTTAPTIIIAPPGVLDCRTFSITIDASASSNGSQYVYRWTTTDGNIVSGGSTLTPEVDLPGTYSLTITNLFNGCSTTQSIQVNQRPNTLTGASLVIGQPDCQNPLGTLEVANLMGGQGPFLFSLDGGLTFENDDLFENISPGDYTFVVEDGNGCQYSQTVQITPPTPLFINLATSLSINLGATQQLNVNVNRPDSVLTLVQWSPPDNLSCADCLEPVLTAHTPGTYTILVQDENGCTASAEILIEVINKRDVFFPSAFSPNDDGLNDWFLPFAPEGTVAKISSFLIFDRWGNLLFQSESTMPNVENSGWNGTYKGKKMDPAVFVFFAEIEFADGTKKIFKGDLTLVK